MKNARAALFAAIAAMSPIGAHAELTDVEKQIVAIVDANADEALTFLGEAVSINSGTMNHDGVKAVGDLFGQAFRDIGLQTEWIDQREKTDRAGHLIARQAGDRGNRVLLIGHLDTVFPKDSDFQSFSIEGDRAIGPGVSDMKGGDVVVLFALKALREAGVLDGAAIEVVFTGDEEKTGKPISEARNALIEAAGRADVALNFEGGERGAAVTGRRGSSSWILKTSGERRHSSGVFSEWVGAGAAFEMARILNEFYEELSDEEYLTFNPGVVVAGTDVKYDEAQNRGASSGKTNVVAQTAIVHGDLRFITEEQKQKARARMRKIVDKHLPKTGAEIEFVDSYPAMTPNDANAKLLGVLSEVSVDLGGEALAANDPGRRGAADISFAAPISGASLDGLGVYGSGAHGPNEDMEIPSLALATRRAAILIYRLTREDAQAF
ncbi:MAG: M20/M25/M40 family metallo-hydrolase [Alphaproteobacteria bacterium]|nr:M20/M25/M40 family metallo-hydrolase [Alphaproteobacteria bacterium]